VAASRRRFLWIGIEVAAVALALGGLVLGLGGLRVSRAGVNTEANHDGAPQVTVFAIVATPGSKVIDPKLLRIRTQLDRLLPHHGFKLLDAQSQRIGKGESVVCDLGNGFTAQTALVRPVDEPVAWPHVQAKDVLGATAGILALAWPHTDYTDALGATAGLLAAQLEKQGEKVHLRCELFLNHALQFSADIRAPLNQLFSCERPFLDDGSMLLIGVGAR
jgi:hypothetical protein